jgi:hypothetical protein
MTPKTTKPMTTQGMTLKASRPSKTLYLNPDDVEALRTAMRMRGLEPHGVLIRMARSGASWRNAVLRPVP